MLCQNTSLRGCAFFSAGFLIGIKRELHILDRCLRGGEAGDGNAERGAGDVVEADLVAELDGGGVAAVLAADTDVQARIDGLAQLDGHIHQLAHAGLVETGERISVASSKNAHT